MVARTARQAVIPGNQPDWRILFVRLRRVLLIIAVGGLLAMGLMKLNDPGFLPVKKVRVQGAFINLTTDMVLSKAGTIQGGYFNIDVNSVKQNIESLAWVDQAYVRRVWPDTLLITVTEQQALAAWQHRALLNIRGELFYPEQAGFPTDLPQLNGPAGTHGQLLEHYQTMVPMLAETGLNLQEMDMDARRSLTLHFANGLTLLLGREEYYTRLKRFLRVYTKVLHAQMSDLQRVDMRYTNGFTVLRKP